MSLKLLFLGFIIEVCALLLECKLQMVRGGWGEPTQLNCHIVKCSLFSRSSGYYKKIMYGMDIGEKTKAVALQK